MKTRMISLILVLSLSIGISVPAFAYNQTNEGNDTNYTVNTEVVYVKDDNGTIIEVQVEERTYYADNRSPFLRSTPQAGDRKTYTFKITNLQLASPFAIGGVVKSAALSKLSDLAAKVVAEKLGASFVPGLNVATAILALIGLVNQVFGNTGFDVTVDLKYSYVFMHKEGYAIEGWDVTGASISTY